tara:strand:- start:5165 stop:6031 length:867 start_codon:yes stop_codon:yes gene_type:complete
MKTVNSISGGKTSAYIASNYPADYNVFALVRTSDKNCMFPDKKIRQVVSDKLGGVEFIGTLEMDTIIYTILDLEQYIGREINWVTGLTFEGLIDHPSNNMLPSPLRRYCTADLKMKPMFEWWLKTIKTPALFRIGFRANEQRRAKNVIEKYNENGFLEMKHIIGKHKNGNNKWKTTEWQRQEHPLISIDNPIYKDDVEKYWKGKPVRFAEINNCVGCFHRSVPLLKKMWETHGNKMQFFSDLEKDRKYPGDTLKASDDITYQKIKEWKLQTELSFDDFDDCDSGYCGL